MARWQDFQDKYEFEFASAFSEDRFRACFLTILVLLALFLRIGG